MRTLGSAPILGPLHDAAKNGDLEQLKQLLDQGTDIEEQDRIVGTALHWAALTDNAEVAQALIAAGADVNSVARGDGTTALHVAAPRGSTEVAAALIEAGANINARNREGRTPLHIAAASNASGAIELLVRSGVDIDEKLRGGATPLSFAVFAGQVDAVRTLLKLGADVNGAPDVDPVFPSTPLKLAIASGLKEIADILRAAGATEQIARRSFSSWREPSGVEVGFWGTIQKFAIAGARHQGTEAQRAQVQNSFADYKRWLAEEMAAL